MSKSVATRRQPTVGTPRTPRETKQQTASTAASSHIRVLVRSRPVSTLFAEQTMHNNNGLFTETVHNNLVEVDATRGMISCYESPLMMGATMMSGTLPVAPATKNCPSSSNVKQFQFDAVGADELTQQKLFETEVQPLLDEALEKGLHATIFAYGQTSSGKTYTISGPLGGGSTTNNKGDRQQQRRKMALLKGIPKVVKTALPVEEEEGGPRRDQQSNVQKDNIAENDVTEAPPPPPQDGKENNLEELEKLENEKEQLERDEEEEEEEGIIPRAIKYIFQRFSPSVDNSAANETSPVEAPTPRSISFGTYTAANPGVLPPHVTCNVSYAELYNERVTDLLHPSSVQFSNQNSEEGPPGGLRIRCRKNYQQPGAATNANSNLQFYVENLFHNECDESSEAIRYFQEGTRRRIVRSHRLNQRSSRSHSLFTITISQRRDDPFTFTAASSSSWFNSTLRRSSKGNFASSDPSADLLISEITFVDLAGSEKLRNVMTSEHVPAATQASKVRKQQMLLRDAQCLVHESIEINTSLLALGRVITSLSQGQKHIPYRESKLTTLLHHALGGSSKTLMIATIHPGFVEETISTLIYAGRARNIKNVIQSSEDPKSVLIRNLKAEIVELRNELNAMNGMLQLSQGLGGEGHLHRDEKAKVDVEKIGILGSASSSSSSPSGVEKISTSSSSLAHQSNKSPKSKKENIIKDDIKAKKNESGLPSPTTASPIVENKEERNDEDGEEIEILCAKLRIAYEKFQESIQMNTKLRDAIDQSRVECYQLKTEKDVLLQENLKLRERVVLLEDIVVATKDSPHSTDDEEKKKNLETKKLVQSVEALKKKKYVTRTTTSSSQQRKVHPVRQTYAVTEKKQNREAVPLSMFQIDGDDPASQNQQEQFLLLNPHQQSSTKRNNNTANNEPKQEERGKSRREQKNVEEEEEEEETLAARRFHHLNSFPSNNNNNNNKDKNNLAANNATTTTSLPLSRYSRVNVRSSAHSRYYSTNLPTTAATTSHAISNSSSKMAWGEVRTDIVKVNDNENQNYLSNDEADDGEETKIRRSHPSTSNFNTWNTKGGGDGGGAMVLSLQQSNAKLEKALSSKTRKQRGGSGQHPPLPTEEAIILQQQRNSNSHHSNNYFTPRSNNNNNTSANQKVSARSQSAGKTTSTSSRNMSTSKKNIFNRDIGDDDDDESNEIIYQKTTARQNGLVGPPTPPSCSSASAFQPALRNVAQNFFEETKVPIASSQPFLIPNLPRHTATT